MQAFFQRVPDFLIDQVGWVTILLAVVHMDEKTSRLHLTFVLLTKNHRLCAKEIIGNYWKIFNGWLIVFRRMCWQHWIIASRDF